MFDSSGAPIVRLDDWRCDDLAHVAALHRDPEVMRYLGGPIDTAMSHRAIERWEREYATSGLGLRPVRNAGGKFVGLAGICVASWTTDGSHLEIAWRLGREHWGHGYATAAARVVLEACSPEDLDKLTALVALENTASQRVAERIGFSRTPTWNATRTYGTGAAPREYGLWRPARSRGVLA